MKKGNVLLIGNSGVGKSTLVNAVLGENRAVTGFGQAGTTKELKLYESFDLPFRIIDTVGFEPSFLKQQAAIGAVKSWSKNSAKNGKEDNQINVIWFCVEGTSSKLFPETIHNLSRATKMWPSVPIIVVITKSYSVPERQQNIQMVYNAFAEQKKYAGRLKAVIPVVAATYTLNDSAYAAPEGITELLEVTHSLLPEGIKAAERDIAQFTLSRKRAFAHSIVGAATTGAAIVGAIPVPIADAMILGPVEIAEVNALAQIYGITKDDANKELLNSIVEVGTVSAGAKAIISILKTIPGVNLGAGIINAVIAGGIVAALGEGSIYAFEQVYLGNKTVDDIDWVKNIIESRFSAQLVEKIADVLEKMPTSADTTMITATVLKAVLSSVNKK